MRKLLEYLMVGVSVTGCALAHAGSGLSSQDYDLYPADFNGDGLTDILYIAKNPGRQSGIVLSDGSGLNLAFQSWGSAYLGIPWSAGVYNVVIGDFDGDGKADILLQRKTPGDHYLLLSEERGIVAISQTISDDTAGLKWSADQHRLVVGDFNGDGKADLFFQAPDATGLNAVLLADANGQFTARKPAQSWRDGFAGLGWATNEANVYAADINGDSRCDLLVQSKPIPGTGPGTMQPAQFVPNMNGVLLAQARTKVFSADFQQTWNRNGFGADWSPLSAGVIVGDFNGDGRADVLLQGQSPTDGSYLLYGRRAGAIFERSIALGASGPRSFDRQRLLVGRFAPGKASGVYLQPQVAGQPSQLASVTETGFSVTVQDVQLAAPVAPLATSLLVAQPATAALAAPAVVTPTSAGRTMGQFATSAQGAATYQIPIWTPPGARGLEPHLALVYASGSPDGMMGPGWNLSGLSSIARCNKTYADNGAPAAVTLTLTDDFCLDGNRLRLTAGTYGVAASTYQTELANFSNVTAVGAAGNGPASFTVVGKDGLTYEYGNTTDSKVFASGGTTPYAWMLNKVRDRQGNNLAVVYATISGAVQPSSIQYTQTPSTNGTTYPYTVSFTYQARVTNLSRYVAGGSVQQTQVLSKVNVQSAGVSVRQYNMTYATAPTTQRDRLSAIQECGGSAGTDCLRATTITYQNGSTGAVNPTTSTGSGATNGTIRSIDIDGDGRQDLVFAVTSGTNYLWYVQFATASGYGSPVSVGLTAPSSANILIDDFLGNGKAEFLAPQGTTWYAYSWSGTAFTATNTGTAVDGGLLQRQAASADGDGDGLPDLWTTPGSVAPHYLNVRRNTSTGGVISFAATPISRTFASSATPEMRGNNSFPNSSINHLDMNGDGRQDVIVGSSSPKGGPFVDAFSFSGTTIIGAMTVGFQGYVSDFLPAKWNDDNCTDAVNTRLNYVQISNCNTVNSVTIPLGGSGAVALDWDGDGRSDVLYSSGGVMMLQRSLGTGASTAVSTGIPAGTGYFGTTDRDGDGLPDLLFVNFNAGNAVSIGMHNGAATPADLLTTVTDGWGISASPSYVPISQNNYSKYADATLPNYDFIGPMYVVGSTVQSDGTGGTYTNSFWYYGAQMNRQGRAFQGFYATRSIDSRNSLVRYVYARRDFPYSGLAFEDDIYQPNASTLISRTVNLYDVKDLTGTGCLSATSRCFPFVSRTTVTTNDISAAAPLIQTSVTNMVYDTFGNATSAATTVTDNDVTSPFSGQSWSTVIANTYTNDTTNWCLGKATLTTTQNTLPDGTTATRRVDHALDAVQCRFTSETLEPTSTTLKVVTTFGYDSCGNSNSLSVVGLDRNGAAMPARVTKSNFGVRCEFPESVTNALNQTASTAYNYSNGHKASTTDPNAVTVSWLYDNFARTTRESRADGTYSTWTYGDCVGTCWGAADLRLLVTQTHYDTAAAVIRSSQQYFDGLERLRFDEGNRLLGTWTNTQVVYNALGLKRYVYQPYAATNNGYHAFLYDWLNRPTSDILYNSSGVADRTTTIAYAGLKSTLTDAKGNATQKWADVSGKLRRIIDPAPGGTTNYSYDPFGNLATLTDAAGATTTNTYNLRGFKTATDDPDTGHRTYTPNSLNELVAQTDARNLTTTLDYDLLGRLTSRLEPESTTATTWTYGTNAALHEIGKLKAVAKPDGYSESYTFDSLGRPAATTISEDAAYTINYSYNNIGSLDVATYPTSTSGYRLALKYVYSYGYLQKVQDNATGSAFWQVSAVNDYSSPTTETFGNGATITSTYTPWTNDVITRQVGTGGSTSNLQNLSYQWDLDGNLQQRQDLRQSLTEVFTYDALNRLRTGTLNGVSNLDVTYDTAGNIVTKNDVGSYVYNVNQTGCTYYSYLQPHAVRKAGSTVYCYDQSGNMVSRGGSAITWYSYNQPNNITAGANSSQFSYNANHQRWKQIAVDSTGTTTTYYIGGMIEKVVRPSGVTEYRHLIPAGSGSAIYTRRSDGTSSNYYVTTDHLGSGDLVLDGTAGVLARESFTPFGARRGSNWAGAPSAADATTFANTTRRGFTGHETLDGVSLIHMNGRVYDPVLARFLSADPLVPTINLSQAINPYAYVMNNPLTLTDPSGCSWLSKLFHAIGDFIGKYWRLILAVVIAIVSFGYLAPIASQWFAASVCLAPGTITAAGAAFAGGVASAISTAIMGGSLKDIARSFVIGAVMAYVGFQVKQGVEDWAHGKGQLYDVTRDPTDADKIIKVPVSKPGFTKVFVNGMNNNLDAAALKALQQTGESSATLFYNPTHGFIADLTEALLQKVTGTSSLGNQLAAILKDSPSILSITAHSQGALIVSNALNTLAGEGFHFENAVSITYYGSAANRSLARDLANVVGATMNQGADHFFDFVGNVVGMNSFNPFRIIGSMLASPTLFMGPSISPHSVYP